MASAFRVVVFLTRFACGFGKRDLAAVDDVVSMMQVNFKFSQEVLQDPTAASSLAAASSSAAAPATPRSDHQRHHRRQEPTPEPSQNDFPCQSEVTIREGITEIPPQIYWTTVPCPELTRVTLPDGLVSIGNQAFRETALTSVNFPDSLRVIHHGAFERIPSLTSVIFNDGLETIDRYAFDRTGLTQVQFGTGIRTINQGAFTSTPLSGEVYLPVTRGTISCLGSEGSRRLACNVEDQFPSIVTLRYYEGASATGDPHVVNVDGQHFDIMKSGVHEFLRLPRRASQKLGSAEPEPLLSVLAVVERAQEAECHESYVKQVDLMGSWLNSSGPLRFRADGDSLDTAQAIRLLVNGSLVDAQSLGRDRAVSPFLEMIEPGTPPSVHVSAAVRKVTMLTAKLSFAAATLKIDWIHRAVPGRLSLNHLNFQVLGLRRFMDGSSMDIGGILGRDDHSDAASLPDECKPMGDDLRASYQSSQVITALM